MMTGIEVAGFTMEAIDPNYTEESESSKFIICHIKLPFRIPLRENFFDVKVENQKVSVELQTQRSGEVVADNHVFDFDRYGQVTRTIVKTKFKKNRKCKLVLTTPIAMMYFKKSVTVIDRLLKACALYEEIYCNRKIVYKDIIEFTIACEEKLVHMVNPLSKETNTSFRLLKNSASIDKIRNFLENGDEVALHDELIINSKDYFLIENYRMASIEIQTGVEYSMTAYVKTMLERKQISPQDIEKVLKYRVDDLTKEITTLDSTITNNKVWSDWKAQCYNLRKKVIHQSYFPDEIETMQAINAGENLIKLLNERLVSQNP